jgi:hypothetical protein
VSAEEGGFLQRWSRRKAAEKAAEPAAEAAPDIAREEPQQAPAQTPAEEFDLSKLPSIESLGQHSDYSMFMHQAVPDELRLKALRRMWTSDPVLAAPDLLDMHQWDYTGNDGIKPLVSPALEAIAAAAKEALDRARKAAESAEKPADGQPATAKSEDEGEPSTDAAKPA